MTDEERRLADLLRNGTPQPPHGLDADELMRGERRSRRLRYWPQLAAAAALVVLAGGIAAVAGSLSRGPHTGAPVRSGTSQHSGSQCTHLGEVASRTIYDYPGQKALVFGFFNTGRSACSIDSLVVKLSGARSGRSDDLTLRQHRPIRLRPGDTVTTNLVWSPHPGWTTRRYTTIELLSPRGHPVVAPSGIVAGVYPKGSAHAGQPAVRLTPVVHNPALTPIRPRVAGLNIYPSTTGPVPTQYADCVLDMQPSLGKVTAIGTRRSMKLYFQNVSGKPCATYAAPGLMVTRPHSPDSILVNPVANGYQVGVLKAGQRGYSTVAWTDNPARPISRYTNMRVMYPTAHYATAINLPISYDISDRSITCTGLRPVGSY